jgi:hypothetical protein
LTLLIQSINQLMLVVVRNELSEYEIERDNITILQQLGEGAYGSVCMAQCTSLPHSNIPVHNVAVKMLKSNSRPAVSDFIQEAVRTRASFVVSCDLHQQFEFTLLQSHPLLC